VGSGGADLPFAAAVAVNAYNRGKFWYKLLVRTSFIIFALKLVCDDRSFAVPKTL
jgi:hypothetical protein